MKLRTARLFLVLASGCAHAPATQAAPFNPAVHRITLNAKPGAPPEVILKQADFQRLGDSIVAVRAEPDLILLDKGEILVASDIHYMLMDANGKTLGRFAGDFDFKVQAGAVKLTPPDSIVALQPGSSILTVSFEFLGNSRKTPFPKAKVSLSVK